jgi:hypothetical protein
MRQVGTRFCALAAIAGSGGRLTARPSVGNCPAPAVAEGVPLRHLTEPVGNDHFLWPSAEAIDVGTDPVENPRVGRNRARGRPGLEICRELAALGLGENVDLTAKEVDAGNRQAERLALPQAQARAEGCSNPGSAG